MMFGFTSTKSKNPTKSLGEIELSPMAHRVSSTPSGSTLATEKLDVLEKSSSKKPSSNRPTSNLQKPSTSTSTQKSKAQMLGQLFSVQLDLDPEEVVGDSETLDQPVEYAPLGEVPLSEVQLIEAPLIEGAIEAAPSDDIFRFNTNQFWIRTEWLGPLGLDVASGTRAEDVDGNPVALVDWSKFPEGALENMSLDNVGRLASCMADLDLKIRYKGRIHQWTALQHGVDAQTAFLLDLAQHDQTKLFAKFFVAGHSALFDAVPGRDWQYKPLAPRLIAFSPAQAFLSPDALASLVFRVSQEVVRPASDSVVKQKVELLDEAGTVLCHHLMMTGWGADDFKAAITSLFGTVFREALQANQAATTVAEKVDAIDVSRLGASLLGVAAGLALAASFKAAAKIKSNDEMLKKIITLGKDIAFALAGLNHPIVGTILGPISPVVGFLLERFLKVRDHNALVSKIQANLDIQALNPDDASKEAMEFWDDGNRGRFFDWINAVLHSNGLR